MPAGRSVLGKLCQRSCVRLEAAGRGPYLKTKGTVFLNTHRPRPANNAFIFFLRRVICKEFLSWIFNAAIFKPSVRVCLTFRETGNLRYVLLLFLLLRSLFTFYVLCSKRKTAGKDSSGPYAGSRWENPDHRSAHN